MDYKCKVALIGDPKSAIVQAITKNSQGYFRKEYISTIGVSFFRIDLKVNNQPVYLQIWNILGVDPFTSVNNTSYLKGSHGAILAYDSTASDVSSKIQERLDAVIRYKDIPITIAFLENDWKQWEKDKKNNAYKLAEQLHCQYFVFSSENGENIDELTVPLSKIMMERIDRELKKNGQP